LYRRIYKFYDNMKYSLFLICFFIPLCYMAPVRPPPPSDGKKPDALEDLHYKDYLSEVQAELENDPGFKEHVSKASNWTDIAFGLDMVHHRVRTKLDEIKRKEVERLNKLERLLHDFQTKGKSQIDSRLFKAIDRDHMDHENPHSFEVKDLEKLIHKVHKDLKLVDNAQEEEYKQYEMEKEHEKQRKLKHAKNEEEKEKLKKEFEESKKRHGEHPAVHHPGSQEQLKEVWEEQDKLDPEDFNPKALFKMHDLNGDGWWDQNEMDAIMQSELNKVYEENNTDDDIRERYHELMRMRQEFTSKVDKNQDGIISFDEFEKWTNSNEFKRDEGWKTEEEMEKPPYTQDEFEQFEKLHPDEEDETLKHHEYPPAAHEDNQKPQANIPQPPAKAENIDEKVKNQNLNQNKL
jgi:hypothetical protein